MSKVLKEFFVNNENETKEFAKEFLKNIKNGDIIILTGDLGVGKTKFVEGTLEIYNEINQISSPTFTIVNEYSLKNRENISSEYDKEIRKINHMDVYRIEEPEEIFDAGIDEYFGNGLTIIEWGEMIEEVIFGKYYKITISKIDTSTKRKIVVEEKENN